MVIAILARMCAPVRDFLISYRNVEREAGLHCVVFYFCARSKTDLRQITGVGAGSCRVIRARTRSAALAVR